MSGTTVLLNLLGGVALLLWGLHTVQTGMNRALGSALHKVVGTATANRFSGFLAGIGATFLLQSSTATAMLVASFAEQGIVSGAGSIAVLLGADLGTALVANFLAHTKVSIVYVILLSGLLLFKLARTERLREVGRSVTGLGLMLLALQLILTASEPLRTSEITIHVFQSLAGEPLLALLVGVGLTWFAHSSLAIVLLVATLAAGGTMMLPVAIALTLGANIGNAIPPFITTIGGKPKLRRIPVFNILVRIVGVAVALPFINPIASLHHQITQDPLVQVVTFHLLFNCSLVIVLLPFTRLLAEGLKRLLPSIPEPQEPQTPRPRFLDPASLDTPTVALAHAVRDTTRMAEITEQMLSEMLQALKDSNKEMVRNARVMDDVIDDFYAALVVYLNNISGQELSEDDSRRRMEILTFTINLEHIGDLLDGGVGERIERKLVANTHIPDVEWQQLQEMFESTINALRLAYALFLSGDPQLARDLMAQKIKFAKRARKLTFEHLGNRSGTTDANASAFFIDVLGELKRVISYASSGAYPILEETGQLRSSRLVEQRDRDPMVS